MNRYCPKCGKQNTMMLTDVEPDPFKLENKPSVPRGDALHAGISFSGPAPLFCPCICLDCDAWFAIFGWPPKGSESTE